MKRIALVPAFCAECASVAFDACAAISMALADFFYCLANTKRDLRECDEDAK